MPVTRQELQALLCLPVESAASRALFGLIDRIEKGLPVSSLERVAQLVAPTDRQFKHRIVPKASLARRQRPGGRRLSFSESERLTRLAVIWSMARNVWGSDEAARAFLFRPHPLLEGRKPIDVTLGTELGARLVEEVLGRLQHGTAA
jgi:putative toxin-antitoxin system antitoxin component (TIGR02293 family)